MKKLVICILGIILLGCSQKNILHTYYGDVATDTLAVWCDEDKSLCYVLKTTKLDSLESAVMGLDSMVEVIYYNPSKDVYSFQLFGSDGGSSLRINFDPDSTATFYNMKNNE